MSLGWFNHDCLQSVKAYPRLDTGLGKCHLSLCEAPYPKADPNNRSARYHLVRLGENNNFTFV